MQKDPLKISIRSNRETDELITVRWSVEVATPWSKYESLSGKISILPGEDRGSIEIGDGYFEKLDDSKIEKSDGSGRFSN